MHKFPIYPVLGLLLLAPMAGCDGEAKDSTTPTDDSKATDDSETPGTTDDDSGTGPTDDVAPPYTFEGSVTVFTTFEGITQCDLEATLTGTPYTGECEDCDYAIEITSDVTRDDGTPGCDVNSKRSFVEGGNYYDMIMASAPEFAGYYYDYTNVLIAGYSYLYLGYLDYPGPYFAPVAYDGSYYGTVTRTGDDLAWTWELSSTYMGYDWPSTDYCGYFPSSSSKEGYGAAGSGVNGDVDCDGNTLDVWTFTADGVTPVQISVDTVATNTAFDPRFILSDADECRIGYADDSFDCTFPPPTYFCPSDDLEVPAAGTYSVLVTSYGDCAGSIAAYELRVVGGSDVTLVQDNITSYEEEEFSVSIAISGSGTLTAQ